MEHEVAILHAQRPTLRNNDDIVYTFARLFGRKTNSESDGIVGSLWRKERNIHTHKKNDAESVLTPSGLDCLVARLASSLFCYREVA